MATPVAFIERKLYRKISAYIPIICVDLLIWNADKKLLLIKRRSHPLKDMWWVVGGRILLGEEPRAAAYRKAREEVGLELMDPRFVGYYSDIYTQNAFEQTKCQTVSLVFQCGIKSGMVKLDEQSSAYKWTDAIPKRLNLVSA